MTIMVSFGYNTSAMAQRYFSVDDERSARKIALLCCGLFFVGAFLWFIPPMAMRVAYPELPRMGLPNASEAAYAVASLTLLPHGLIESCWRPCSAPRWRIFGQFNVKSAILTKDIYQSLFRKSAGEHELLVVGWITTFLIGGATTAIAVIMAASGQSVFQIMLTFNTLMSLAYGRLRAGVGGTPDASVVWLASFATGLILGMLGAFVYHWSLIQQVAIIIPASFGVFFLTTLFDTEIRPGEHCSSGIWIRPSTWHGIEGFRGLYRTCISFPEPHDFLHWFVESGAALYCSIRSANNCDLVCCAHGCGGRVFMVRAWKRERRKTNGGQQWITRSGTA